MQQGIIYILLNASMPGLLKIGMTSRSAEDRAREISATTGVPTPFVVAYEEQFADCELAERELHHRLARYRFNLSREFFSIPLKEAISVVVALKKHFDETKQGAVDAKESIQMLDIRVLPSTRWQKPLATVDLEILSPPGTHVGVENAVAAFSSQTRTVPESVAASVCVNLKCSPCSAEYSVTLKRGERTACCPVCRAFTSVTVPW